MLSKKLAKLKYRKIMQPKQKGEFNSERGREEEERRGLSSSQPSTYSKCRRSVINAEINQDLQPHA